MVTCMGGTNTRRAIKEVATQMKYIVTKVFSIYRCLTPCLTATVHRKAVKVDPTATMTANGPDAAVTTLGEEGPVEWEADVDDGVLITLVSLPEGGNRMKRIRFREVFDARQAKMWWTENIGMVMELYSVQTSPPQTQSPLSSTESPDPWSSLREDDAIEDGDESYNSMHESTDETTSSMEAASISSNTSKCNGDDGSNGIEEWEEIDEPGVTVTIRSFPDGTREIKHVNLSRERFDEATARVWWQENRARLHDRYVVFYVF